MSENKKPIILMFCDYYLPGYKSGGGMRTIVNMVDRLHHKYDFRIVTRDHDLKLEKEPYETVNINQWNLVGNAQVYYISRDNIGILKLRELIIEVEPDLLYANSFFATLSILVVNLKKLKLIPQIKMIVAPCGEFADSALNIKSAKKRVYLGYAKLFNLYRDFIWKASTEIEINEIFKVQGKVGEIFVSPDLPPQILFENYVQKDKPIKRTGEARIIFLSRFVRIKNFKWLLENLKDIRGLLEINVYGPLEDIDYWRECAEIIEKLPENIKVESKGGIVFEETEKVLFDHHFFVLPTQSENFGHVFLEALASGCPLIISDRTPWLGLKKKQIGWDLSLENPQEWINVINHCIAMDKEEYEKYSSIARSFAVKWLEDKDIEKETTKLLDYSLVKTLG